MVIAITKYSTKTTNEMKPRLIRKTFIFASTEYHDYGEFKQNRAQKALRFTREKTATANSQWRWLFIEVIEGWGGWKLMGNQKQKWTAAEEEALLAGVRKHGTGKWRIILKDPDFAPSLIHRTNIDLKVSLNLPFYRFLSICCMQPHCLFFFFLFLIFFVSNYSSFPVWLIWSCHISGISDGILLEASCSDQNYSLMIQNCGSVWNFCMGIFLYILIT